MGARLAARWLPVLLAAAAAWQLRLKAADSVAPGRLEGDEAIYWRLGTHWAEHGVLGYEAAIPSAFRAPLYPAFVAAARGSASPSPARVRRAQALLGAAGAVLLYLSGCLLAGAAPAAGAPPPAARAHLAGLAAAWLWALHPELVAGSAVLRSEALDALLTAAAAYFMLRFVAQPGAGRAAAWGLSLGVALSARSVLLLVPWGAALAGLALKRRLPRRRSWIPALLLGSFLPLLLWVARNALQFGALIPFERHPATLSLHHASLGTTDAQGLADSWREAAALAPELGRLDSAAADRAVWRLAWRNMAADPLRFARAFSRRAWLLWSPHAGLLCAAAAALWLGRRRREAWALAALGAYFTINAVLDPHGIRMQPALGPLALLAGSALLGLRRPVRFPFDPGDRAWSPRPEVPAALLLALYLPAQFRLLGETRMLLPELLARPAGYPEPKVYLDRAVLLARDGREPEALRLLERGAFAYPRYAALHMTHGALLAASGRRREAALAYGRALAILDGRTPVDALLEQAREGLAAAQVPGAKN